jgi:hypothetical protein
MKSDNPLKHFALAFLLAAVCYSVFYRGIEHRRTHKGPWEVTFTHGADGAPAVVVNQPALAITNFEILFSEATSVLGNGMSKTIFFSVPKPVPFDVPFGKCLFMDTTFLPGTVTFQMFGHEIEFLPRVLLIDRQEHPWLSETTNTLHAIAYAPETTKP